MKWQNMIEDLDACREARRWMRDYVGENAWYDCERGDWLLWLATKVGVDRRLVVAAGLECLEPLLQYTDLQNEVSLLRAWLIHRADIEKETVEIDESCYSDMDPKSEVNYAIVCLLEVCYGDEVAAIANEVIDAVGDAYIYLGKSKADSYREAAIIIRKHITLEMVHGKLEEASY